MIIFIGTDGKELSSRIAKRFGPAEYYLIYNSESKGYDIASNSEHDKKHTTLIDAINNGIDTFIVGNIGPYAFGILNTIHTKIYLARKITAQEALNKLANNELELLTEPTVKKSMHKH